MRETLREILRERRHLGTDLGRGLQGIRTRRLEDRKTSGWLAVKLKNLELDAPDVAHPCDLA